MRLNLLVSYAYWNKTWERFFERVKRNTSLMVDSGAFTAHFSGKKVTLDGYCAMLDTVKDFTFSYIQLDVLGDAVATRVNLDEMRRRGYEPMPVLTIDAPESDYDFFVDSTPHRRVCVAGGGTCAPDWFLSRVERLARRRPEGLIHALGFTAGVKLYHAPVATVDSSTYSATYRWGWVSYYDPLRGVINLFNSTTMKTCTRISQTKTLPKRWDDLPKEFAAFAQRSGIPLAHICDTRPRTMPSYRGLITLAAWMQYAERLQQTGTTMFFAGASPSTCASQIAPVIMNWKDGEFDYPGAVRDAKAILSSKHKFELILDMLVDWSDRQP